ncbi:MAG: PilZ domain-containing protein [Candidatus Omnitrophica bacterium]|nr:PilZ domain-containing protein [Candidatus Omnitrophota bacterium]
MRIRKDKRIFERIEGELAVRYSPQGSDREFCATTRNISGGGLRMSLLKKLSPGTVLDLEIFKYNTDIKARCRGKIIWVWDTSIDKESDHLFEAGIQFINGHLFYIGRLIGYLEGEHKSL